MDIMGLLTLRMNSKTNIWLAFCSFSFQRMLLLFLNSFANTSGLRRKKMRKFIGFTLIFAAFLIFSGTVHANTLYAGQHIIVGSVSVENDEDFLYVTYKAVDGWELSELQLSATTTFEAIPCDNKGPKIGLFSYKYEGPNSFDIYEFKIPLADIGVAFDQDVYVAAHAVVEKTDMSIPDGGPEETAWASGTEFAGSWAMWFTERVEAPQVAPILPAGIELF
jgi:hypothetical protein